MWKKARKLLGRIKANKRTTELAVLVVLFIISGASLLYMRHTRAVDATNESLADRPVAQHKSASKLYFKDEKSLPKTYSPGQDLTFSFVIQNHEGKAVDYPFVVTINGNQVAAHSLTVKNNTDQKVEQTFTLPSDQQALVIEVKLTDQNQVIHFSLKRL